VIKTKWEKEVEDDNFLTTTKSKLERCKKALIDWSSAKYGGVVKSLKFLTKRLERLQKNEFVESRDTIKHLKGEINHLLEMEDTH